MSKMIAVFSFEEPEDSETMARIIGTLKEHFQELDDVKAHLAKDRAAAYVMEFFQSGIEVRSPHVEHAKRELALLDNDADFNESIVKAISAFFSYGHSGGSAAYGIGILNELLQGKNLSMLTDNPREWNLVGNGTWQSRRCSEAFSPDGGKTFYLLSEGASEQNPEPLHHSAHFEVDEFEKSEG